MSGKANRIGFAEVVFGDHQALTRVEKEWEAVSAEDVRRVAGALPRSEEHLIRDQVKFRVGRIVFVAISPDERSMGFGFPKEERAALVASGPHKFHMPARSDEPCTARAMTSLPTPLSPVIRIGIEDLAARSPSRLLTRARARRAAGRSRRPPGCPVRLRSTPRRR